MNKETGVKGKYKLKKKVIVEKLQYKNKFYLNFLFSYLISLLSSLLRASDFDYYGQQILVKFQVEISKREANWLKNYI